MAIDLGKLRWLMFEQGSTSISLPLLWMLVFWLVIVSRASASSHLVIQPLLPPYFCARYRFQVRSS